MHRDADSASQSEGRRRRNKQVASCAIQQMQWPVVYLLRFQFRYVFCLSSFLLLVIVELVKNKKIVPFFVAMPEREEAGCAGGRKFSTHYRNPLPFTI